MPVKGSALTISYSAWNGTSNSFQTGDVSHHSLKLILDGAEVTPANSPNEIDAANAPGQYRISLTSAEMNANSITLTGKSSTAGVMIIPVRLSTQ